MSDTSPQPSDIASVLRRGLTNQQDVANWDRGDFLHGFGAMQGALIYSVLFAPTFVEVEGCIFLTELGVSPSGEWDELAASVRAARAKSSLEVAKLVESCNWLEVAYLFSDHRGSDDEEMALAQVIADAWRVRLRGLYPERRFDVRVATDSTQRPLMKLRQVCEAETAVAMDNSPGFVIKVYFISPILCGSQL